MLSASMPRKRFDALAAVPAVGERVHVLGRAEYMQKKGELRLTVIDLQQVGLGMLLRQIEELRQKLARGPVRRRAQTVAAAAAPHDRPGVGSDAAAKRDVVETATGRYPPVSFASSKRWCRAPARRCGSRPRSPSSMPTPRSR